MKKDSNLRLLVEGLKDSIRGMGPDMAKEVGTLKEPVPTDIQYQAWLEMTPAERGQKAAQMGVVKAQQWYAAMAKMEAKRNAS